MGTINSNYRQNIGTQLQNDLDCVRNCLGVYDQKSGVNSVREVDWTAAELAMVASNATK